MKWGVVKFDKGRGIDVFVAQFFIEIDDAGGQGHGQEEECLVALGE